MKVLPVVLAAAIAASSAARADVVAGWDVTLEPAADNVCTAQRREGDKSLSLSFDKDNDNRPRIVFELGNAAWTLDPRAEAAAALVVGTQGADEYLRWFPISPNSLFTMNVAPDQQIARLKAASSVGIHFPGGKQQDTTVGLAGFAQMLPVLQACQSKMK